MAEAPEDPSKRDHLEQKVLQVLGDASSPLKTHQLVKECQVPKKELNQALYRMAKEGMVSQVAPATWCLGAGDPGAQKPQPEAADILESPGPQLSMLEERICGFLKANGPCKALHIAQALGMQTAKDVNPTLYKMKTSCLLDLDQQLQVWSVSEPEDSGKRNQSAAAVRQQNPIYMIYQNGLNCHINIADSEAIQIGYGNTILKHSVSGDNGPSAPHRLPSTEPGGSSTQRPLAGAWRPQEIHMERSLLRRVQVGHSNEMSLHSVPSTGPAHTLSGSPPVSATATGSEEASFDAWTPQPGPHPKAAEAQRVHIKSCFLEDTTIGNGNRLTVLPEAGEGRQDGRAQEEHTGARRWPGQPGPSWDSAEGPAAGRKRRAGFCPRDATWLRDPSSEASPSTSNAPQDRDQDPPGKAVPPTTKLRAMTLEESGPHPAEPSTSAASLP